MSQEFPRSQIEPVAKTKVVFCYPIVNGYIAACWRELASDPRIDLSIISFASQKTDSVGFHTSIMCGLDHHLLEPKSKRDPKKVARLVEELNPDMLFVSGWAYPAFRKLYLDSALAKVPIAMLMDNQFRGDLRQMAGRYLLHRVLRRINCLFVTGERSHQLARYWAVPEEKIVRGCVSVDYASLSPLLAQRIENGIWPKSFLYVGRYVREKSLDVLVEAYKIYRDECLDPWPLRCAGMGPESDLLKAVPGIEDLGFVAPEQLGRHWVNAGCFVLASRFDPWPLVVVEAGAAGLPIIATDICGSTVENVHHLFNGYIAPTSDARQIANGMKYMHTHHSSLLDMGRSSQQFAAAYSAEIWAKRVKEIIACC